MSEKIDGVPEGWRLVRIGAAMRNEWIIHKLGDPIQVIDNTSSSRNYCIIEKILTYRNVTQDDIGKMVEINIGGYWYERKLLAILPEKFDDKYIFETAGGNYWHSQDDARIKE